MYVSLLDFIIITTNELRSSINVLKDTVFTFYGFGSVNRSEIMTKHSLTPKTSANTQTLEVLQTSGNSKCFRK